MRISDWSSDVCSSDLPTTSRGPSAAVAAICSVAVAVVALTTCTLLTVMPSPKPDANEVSASKPMPVSVTSTPVPCAPLAGDTAGTLNCAKAGMSPNDTAEIGRETCGERSCQDG